MAKGDIFDPGLGYSKNTLLFLAKIRFSTTAINSNQEKA